MSNLSLTAHSSQTSATFILAFDVTFFPHLDFWLLRQDLMEAQASLDFQVLQLHAWFNVTFKLFRKDKG